MIFETSLSRYMKASLVKGFKSQGYYGMGDPAVGVMLGVRGRISVGHRRRPGRAQVRALPVDHEKECFKVGF